MNARHWFCWTCYAYRKGLLILKKHTITTGLVATKNLLNLFTVHLLLILIFSWVPLTFRFHFIVKLLFYFTSMMMMISFFIWCDPCGRRWLDSLHSHCFYTSSSYAFISIFLLLTIFPNFIFHLPSSWLSFLSLTSHFILLCRFLNTIIFSPNHIRDHTIVLWTFARQKNFKFLIEVFIYMFELFSTT